MEECGCVFGCMIDSKKAHISAARELGGGGTQSLVHLRRCRFCGCEIYNYNNEIADCAEST